MRSVGLRSVIALLLFGTLLPAMGTAGSAPRREVVVGLIQEPDTLNSIVGTNTSYAVTLTMMDMPTNFDNTWRLVPTLVERIPSVENGDWRILPDSRMELTWRVRRGVRWHDGREVTAEDLAFTCDLASDPRVPRGTALGYGFAGKLDKVVAKDRYTAVATWRQFFPFANIGVCEGGLVPKHVVEPIFRANPEGFKESQYGRNPRVTIGNGPFILKSWTAGNQIVFEANPNYWRGKPALDRVIYRIFSDANVMMANVVAGALDVVSSGFTGIGVGQAIELEGLMAQGRLRGYRVTYGPSLTMEALRFNVEAPTLQDRRVRQALAFAANREEISRALFQGKQPVAHSPIPQGHRAYLRDIKRYDYDPERAKRLLDEAGWRAGPDGIRVNAQGEKLTVVLTTTTGQRDRERMEQILQTNWRQIGVDVVIENFPARVLFSTIYRQRRFKGALLDDLGFRTPFFSLPDYDPQKVQPVGEVSENVHGWRNSDAARIIRAYDQEPSEAKRNALLLEFQRVWMEELPTLPIVQVRAANVYRVGLRNYKPVGWGVFPDAFTWNIWEWTWE